MKVALITTTINVPRVLSLYRAHDPNVMFFVAGDLKTPYPEIRDFLDTLPRPDTFRGPGAWRYLPPDEQKCWKSSELIGWNTDSRRNFALLEAMRWGAEIIVSVDDDMIPNESVWSGEIPDWTLFDRFERLFVSPFNGLQLGFDEHWFDAGVYTLPEARQRGLPLDGRFSSGVARGVTGAEIGAAQGIILATPDTDACTAFDRKPFIHSASDILKNGFVVDLLANAVFNSQFTAFRAELAPAFAQFYFAQQRNTDIFSSLLMRRIMREKNWHTYFGQPTGFHARKPRPFLKDLEAERYGVDNIARYADYLNRAPLPSNISVTEQCRILAQGWNGPELEAAMAFYDDAEAVMK